MRIDTVVLATLACTFNLRRAHDPKESMQGSSKEMHSPHHRRVQAPCTLPALATLLAAFNPIVRWQDSHAGVGRVHSRRLGSKFDSNPIPSERRWQLTNLRQYPVVRPTMMAGFGTSSPSKSKMKKPLNRKQKKEAQKAAGRRKREKLYGILSNMDPEARNKFEEMDDAQKKVAANLLTGLNEDEDIFWQVIPEVLKSEFPADKIKRVLDVIRFARGKCELDEEVINDPLRPHENMHAYMPGIPASPWHPLQEFSFFSELEANAEAINAEFDALRTANVSFQSVEGMNYDMLLMYVNAELIPGFPYHLCPVTKSILDKFPLAGRIAGFSRQSANSSTPLVSNGNNMWLTMQMGVKLPSDVPAAITVADDEREVQFGKCLVYDTTYLYKTSNPSPSQEYVSLLVNFWNNQHMSLMEVAAMKRMYAVREQFLEKEDGGLQTALSILQQVENRSATDAGNFFDTASQASQLPEGKMPTVDLDSMELDLELPGRK